MTQPREISGPVKTRAQAETNGQLWELAGAQEDALVLSNEDKERIRQFVKDAVTIYEKSQKKACGPLNWRCW